MLNQYKQNHMVEQCIKKLINLENQQVNKRHKNTEQSDKSSLLFTTCNNDLSIMETQCNNNL